MTVVVTKFSHPLAVPYMFSHVRFLDYNWTTTPSGTRIQKQELNYKEDKLQCTILIPEGKSCTSSSHAPSISTIYCWSFIVSSYLVIIDIFVCRWSCGFKVHTIQSFEEEEKWSNHSPDSSRRHSTSGCRGSWNDSHQSLWGWSQWPERITRFWRFHHNWCVIYIILLYMNTHF